MCRAGGPRCSDNWGNDQKFADHLRRRLGCHGLKTSENEESRHLVEVVRDHPRITSDIKPEVLEEERGKFPPAQSFKNLTFREVDDEILNAQPENLSPDEEQALFDYSSSSFGITNATLRGQKIQTDSLELVSKTVSNLDSIFEKSPRREPVLLYRGLSISDDEYDDFMGKHVTGSIVSDRGFASMSAVGSKAAFFAGVNGSSRLVVYRVRASNVIPMGQFSMNTSEREYVGPRNMKMVVVGVHEGVEGPSGYSRKVTVIDVVDSTLVSQE